MGTRRHNTGLNGTMLTRRDKEILHWLSHGKTAWEIGQILNKSEKTIEWRIARIMRGLGVNNRTHAVAQAIRQGIIDGCETDS